MTQERTRKECLSMAEDLVESLAQRPNFRVTAHYVGNDRIELSANRPAELTRLILKRQRTRSGLSLAEVAERLGATSRNAYARFEQGRSTPTVEKLDQLLRAVSPDRDFVIGQSQQ